MDRRVSSDRGALNIRCVCSREQRSPRESHYVARSKPFNYFVWTHVSIHHAFFIKNKHKDNFKNMRITVQGERVEAISKEICE